MTDRYFDKSVAFLTQHGKEALIGSAFKESLGCHVVRAEGFDTDLLGTFSGDVKRPDTQIQTARRKAQIGMELTGFNLGLASEGAFVPDPFSGLIPWNIEVLVWIDKENQLEIIVTAQGPARSLHRAIKNFSELEKFAYEAGFPEHHLLLRPQSENDLRVKKGIANSGELKQAFEECQKQASNQTVFAENDLRAFCNPTRQSMIRLAAQDLLSKIQSNCPLCETPGFSMTEHVSGLLCSACRKQTKLAKSFTWCCEKCDFKLNQPNKMLFADPSRCDFCNP